LASKQKFNFIIFKEFKIILYYLLIASTVILKILLLDIHVVIAYSLNKAQDQTKSNDDIKNIEYFAQICSGCKIPIAYSG